MDDDDAVAPEKYEMHLWMEGATDGGKPRYSEEHWFAERPAADIVAMLFDDAKQTFRGLYPDIEPVDFSVTIRRLRPADNFRPDYGRLLE